MSIGENTIALRKEIPEQLTLVAVSKTKSNEEIMEAYQSGQRVFGENKIQEMSAKYEALPKDIQWHMIGHVQSNKVKYMAPFVDLIHGVDRSKLLREIDKQALKNNRIIDCLLQIHIAQESTKFGFSESEITEALDLAGTLNNVRVVGLMGMATFTENTQQITEEFKGLKRLFDQLKPQQPQFSVLSMGMSGDYPLAIAQGSNMIRVGSKIFGARNY
ncbi:MAG: YggS family pyridoxal phosphate-dependent enzyme [Flavobacteriaceae bacterium]|jgi:pyridoxal phosphate enzyme (YggS family)|nr:YggS family pyridoxal phosphate-dependent enzyme [Flavobacteriaceae bacterium]MCH1608309.1 YggS family pyridoxal phosphate-dependent enzyme [Flavobacteriaceae bacterium]MDG1968865.1 YggS family pyridoxal phosphate-dependent enzyme [Flavobacteriaceae bacterium]HCZ09351.1 YggS family pyridoxal phosphate-dependent enzyme [Flavobacteriaceae bacterium]